MKKIIIGVLLFLPCNAVADPMAYPGSAWGIVSSPSTSREGTPESGDWMFTGKVTQGIDWFKFGSNKWTLDTYATVGVNMDSKRIDYNSKLTPAIGIKISRAIPNGVVDIGVQAMNETRFGNKYIINNRSGNGVQVYISYWQGWGRR